MDDPVRIVMVGKTGVGKSSTANTILGGKVFEAKAKAKSVTRECAAITTEVHGHNISLVDTPGLFDTDLPNEVIAEETAKCLTMLVPGPHVFLIVVQTGRFTKEEKEALAEIQNIFGTDIHQFAIVVFTKADDLEDETIDDYVEGAGEDLRSVIAKCGNRYHPMNNRDKNAHQVISLLEKIQDLKEENGTYYVSAMFANAKLIREREKMIEEQKKAQNDLKLVEKLVREKEEARRKLVAELQEAQSKSKKSCTIL